MNAAVGPRKVIAQERFFHNTAIAVAALLSCAPLAWSQTPSDKATGSTEAAAPAGQPKKARHGGRYWRCISRESSH